MSALFTSNVLELTLKLSLILSTNLSNTYFGEKHFTNVGFALIVAFIIISPVVIDIFHVCVGTLDVLRTTSIK